MARPIAFDESKVLTAAMMCFWQHGYGATSMKNLEAATQLTSGSLYNSFGSKEQLFFLVLEFYSENIVGKRIRKFLQNDNAYSGIKDFIFNCFDNSIRPNNMACLLVNSATELAPHETRIKEYLALSFKRVDDAMIKAIERGQLQGDINAAKNPKQLAKHLNFLLNGMLVSSKVVDTHQSNWKNTVNDIVSSVLD